MAGWRHIWLVDFEFRSDHEGDHPIPVCMVAKDLVTGRRIELWGAAGLRLCPFSFGDDVLFVSYYAIAELRCMIRLGWPLPTRILDLFVEFRAMSNGKKLPLGNSLLGALGFFGLAHMAPVEKKEMQALAMRGPETAQEMRALVDYCGEDVDALARLLPCMEGWIAESPERFSQALFRGRYMSAAAQVEDNGVPVDVALLTRFTTRWSVIKRGLIAEVDGQYDCFDENGSFRQSKFAALIDRMGLAWPRTPSGMLATDSKTMRDMAKAHPELDELRELLASLGQTRLFDLAVGSDGRNRAGLSAFRSRTGRNQPSSVGFIFGPSAWLRNLIQPPPGKATAYVDWVGQEVGIAAVLSGDPAMLAAIQSGDFYIAFAKRAGLLPADATKETHREPRERIKSSILGMNYGMQRDSLAMRINSSLTEAQIILRAYFEQFPILARWRQNVLNIGFAGLPLITPLGWPVEVQDDSRPNSIMNHPVQSAGADMMRLAVCLAVERGVRVACPVHDALLVEDDIDRIEDTVRLTQQCMAEASRAVLDGYTIATEVKITRYPDRFSVDGKPGAARLFQKIMRLTVEDESLDLANHG